MPREPRREGGGRWARLAVLASGALLVTSSAAVALRCSRVTPAGRAEPRAEFADAVVSPPVIRSWSRVRLADLTREILPAALPHDRAAPPSPSAAAGDPCTVILLVGGDAPLAGAELLLQTEGGAERLGASDAGGTLTLPWRTLAGRTVVARSVGHAPRAYAFGDEFEELAVLELRPAGQIAGRLVFADGRPVGPGVRVIAWDTEEQLAASELVRRTLGGDVSVALAETDAGGEFELGELDPGRLYALAAGGGGLLTPEPAYALQVGGPPLELVVESLHGALVRLVDAGEGGPARLARGVLPELERYHLDHLGARRIAAGGLAATLAWPETAWHAEPWERILLFAAPRPEERLGPIRFEAAYAGYAPLSVALEAEPVSGELPVVVVELTSQARRRGMIRVILVGDLLGYSSPAAPRQALGELELIPVPGGGAPAEPQRFSLGELRSAREQIFHGVPAGLYRPRVTFRNGSFTWPPAGAGPVELEVGIEPATLEIDVAGLGAIELELRNADGSLYAGSVELTLGEGPPPAHSLGAPVLLHGGSLQYVRHPFRITGLVSGEYTVLLRRPASASGVFPVFRTVSVHAGELTPVALQLGS